MKQKKNVLDTGECSTVKNDYCFSKEPEFGSHPPIVYILGKEALFLSMDSMVLMIMALIGSNI